MSQNVQLLGSVIQTDSADGVSVDLRVKTTLLSQLFELHQSLVRTFAERFSILSGHALAVDGNHSGNIPHHREPILIEIIFDLIFYCHNKTPSSSYKSNALIPVSKAISSMVVNPCSLSLGESCSGLKR